MSLNTSSVNPSEEYLTLNKFNTFRLANPQGTVTSVGAGTGLEGGAITSNGTISLHAYLNDLQDVSSSAPISNTQVLTWDVSSNTWMPKSFTSTVGNLFDTGQISNFHLGNLEQNTGSLLQINGTNIVPTFNNFFNNLISGPGIASSTYTTGNDLRVALNLSSIPFTFNNLDGDSFLIVNSDGDQYRLPQYSIDVTTFNNPSYTSNGFLTFTDLSNILVSPDPNINISTASTKINFKLSDSFYGIVMGNVLASRITGVLPIVHGGTGGSNITEAHANLHLIPNANIMAYTSPRFIGNLMGSNIGGINYITFDGNEFTGSSGNGFRIHNGIMQFKDKLTGTGIWGNIKQNIPGANNLPSAGTRGNILFSNGHTYIETGFVDGQGNGNITLTSSNNAILNVTNIDPIVIKAGSIDPITIPEFGQLTGGNILKGSIQQQLDEKIFIDSSLTMSAGDMIYYTGNDPKWNSIPAPFPTDGQHSLLSCYDSSNVQPRWTSLSETLEPKASIPYIRSLPQNQLYTPYMDYPSGNSYQAHFGALLGNYIGSGLSQSGPFGNINVGPNLTIENLYLTPLTTMPSAPTSGNGHIIMYNNSSGNANLLVSVNGNWREIQTIPFP